MSAPETRTLRRELEAALAAGETGRALDRMRALFASDPTSPMAAVVLRGFERLRHSMPWVQELRVHVLRSFTVEPMVPLVRAEAALHGVALSVELGDLGTHVQAILDTTSPLYTTTPDVVVVALRLRDVAPRLVEGFADLDEVGVQDAVRGAVDDLTRWLTRLREASQARILVHGFELPEPLAHGVLDAGLAASQQASVLRIEEALLAFARSHRDVHVVDVRHELGRIGTDLAHDETKWLTMRMPYRPAAWVALARAWVRRFVPMTGRAAKCVVVDLDHTLWGGVLGEDGIDGLRLGIEHPGSAHRALQRTLRDLARRGLMLAVASKNDEPEAMRVIDTHPEMLLRVTDFVAFQIHWRPKTESLAAIAACLGIGVDALVFVDDNPVERAAVSEALPMVHVVDLGSDPMGYARAVADHPAVQRLVLSREDRDRGALVASDRAREALASSASDLEDFHRSLGMAIEWSHPTPATLPRLAQLTLKTNQFNSTTIRRSESELAALAASPDVLVRSIRVRDRFGDNGLVGLLVVRVDGRRASLDTLLMSCRVIGRTVETAMLALLAEELHARGVLELDAEVRPTAKNGPSRDVFTRHGFAVVATDADGVVLHRSPIERLPSLPPWFEREAVAGHRP